MSRKKRIPKTQVQRLVDCETHLYFLCDACRLYSEQPDRYKQVAAELRILVGDHKPDRRLLIAMMEKYRFSYDVQPPGPPFDKQSISMVGWRDDPAHIALAAEVEAAMGDTKAIEALLEKQSALRRPVPFPEYVENGLAVFIKPYDYSFRDLVCAIAQQEGSGHEDPLVDEPLAQMHSVIIGNEKSHVAALMGFANLVIKVGSLFLGHVVDNHGYQLRYVETAAT